MKARSLARFVALRVLAMVLLLVAVSFIVFTMLYLAPGSAEQVLIGTRPSSPELVEALRQEFHLNLSFLDQYWLWLSGAAHLDFGSSIRTTQPVMTSVSARAPITLFLGVYAFLIAFVVGVPLGILAAVRSRSVVDRSVVGLSVLGVSAPVFVTGLMLLYLFGVTLDWFPIFGPGEGFPDRLWHMTLPALALALSAMALIVKITRAAMIAELSKDYVAFARARGVSSTRAVFRHALRNALVPLITASAIVLTTVITGAVLVESVFALDGLGSLLVESVQYQDLPMLQAIALLAAALVIIVNIGVDILYVVVDPRIRLQGGDR